MKDREELSNELPVRRTLLALGLLGLGVSLYLTLVHYTEAPLVCLGTSGCETVNRSAYSEVAGIAVALLGAGAYLTILGLLGMETYHLIQRQTATLGVFGISLAGTLYSAYLTYVEIVLLRAICSWCVISAVTMTIIFALALVRLRALVVSTAKT